MSEELKRLIEAYRLGEFELEGGSPTVEALSVTAVDNWGQDEESLDSFAAGYQRAIYELRDLFSLLAQPSGGALTNEGAEPVVCDFSDAYEGARDELLEWKRRALEAEAKARKYDQRIVDLGVLGMQAAVRKRSSLAPALVVLPRLQMSDVVKAHMDIPNCPVLTSNQCHELAMKLNACLDRVKELNP